MESKRQLKASKLIQRELSIYFQQNLNYYKNTMISVTVVRISPDLGLAKVYLSIFPQDKSGKIFTEITRNNKKIRYEIAKKVRNQFRKIPEFAFFIDDSLDYAEQIEKLLI